MKKYQLAFLLSAIILSLIAFSFSVNAQDDKSSNTNQKPTISPTPKPSPTAIPLGNVVAEAEKTSKTLQEIQTNLSDNPSVAIVQTELPKLSEELELRVTETNQILRAWTSDTAKWVVVQSDLAVAMHEALAQANIEIPFPQRDLNLKIVDKELLKSIQTVDRKKE